MEKLKYAQDLIKSKNGSINGGFNMFIYGHERPKPNDYYDYGERIQGFDFAEKMAKENGIAFTHNFGCNCGGHAFQYGGFFVCNSCGGKGVDKDWWKIKVKKDGNAYCCHGLDFVNLQESNNVAFGDIFEDAIENYGKLMLQL
jgi:hypothetical protein